jgi:hypothetical protein
MNTMNNKKKKEKIKSKKFVVFGDTNNGPSEIIGYVATTDESFEITGVREFGGVLGHEVIIADYEVNKIIEY